MSKETISSSYLASTKFEHSGKTFPEKFSVLLTGAGKLDSIGASISKKLKASERAEFVFDYYFDVLGDALPTMKGIDVLVMSHGTLQLDWVEDLTDFDMKRVIDVNLIGSIRLVQHFVRETIDNGKKKKIISIGSMAYKSVLNGSSAYCASKAGLAHFMKCAAWELAPKGYELFSVHPSNTENTPMAEETVKGLMRYRGLSRQQAESYWAANLPMENWLQAEDVADVVSFLIEGNSTYLSGSNLDLAGGQR